MKTFVISIVVSTLLASPTSAAPSTKPNAYPKGVRETHDLLRRRMYLVHKRAEVIAHVVNTNSQYNDKLLREGV